MPFLSKSTVVEKQHKYTMQIQEIITEASAHSRSIKADLIGRGYQYLGQGSDSMAFLEPGTGMVLKILGTNLFKSDDVAGELTRPQKVFKLFADYCQQHPDNEFLPQMSGWNQFMYQGRPYLQIRMERLFPFKGRQGVVRGVYVMANWIYHNAQNKNVYQQFLKRFVDKEPRKDSESHFQNPRASREEQLWVATAITYLGGEEKLQQFFQTVLDLVEIARKNSYRLYNGHVYIDFDNINNYAMGSDGHVVLFDPLADLK